jgi:hypothetical protein
MTLLDCSSRRAYRSSCPTVTAVTRRRPADSRLASITTSTLAAAVPIACLFGPHELALGTGGYAMYAQRAVDHADLLPAWSTARTSKQVRVWRDTLTVAARFVVACHATRGLHEV